MSRRVVAILMCVSLAILVAAAMAQSPTARQPLTTDPISNAAPDPFADPTNPHGELRINPGKPAGSSSSSVDYTVTQTVKEEFVRDQTKMQTVNELVNKWKQARNKSDRDKVQQSLHAALKEQFQARLDAHEKEVEKLETEVKRLREQLELRRTKQDEIVKFRLEQLLRDAQGLGWGTEPVTMPTPNTAELHTTVNVDPFTAEPQNAVPATPPNVTPQPGEPANPFNAEPQTTKPAPH
ncbi:MAG: hypothetical protein ACLP9L_16540 [Thermoguttaceae bacterium]